MQKEITVGTGDFKQLLYAARDGDLESVKYWIRRGANPNFLHAEFLFSPFHISVRNQHLDVMRYLLENGADPHKSEGYSVDTPLSIAQANSDEAAVALLESFGVEVERRWLPQLRQRVEQRVMRWLSI